MGKAVLGRLLIFLLGTNLMVLGEPLALMDRSCC